MANLHESRNRATQGTIPREEMYREWLGIANPAPSYYGLLGLPELETDEAAVLGAGRRVKRKVRAYQIGLYRKQALGLLAEVGQAVSVLTNAKKRKVYDGELLARWRGAVEELYEAHCNGEAKEPAVLEAWLTACRMRGVPVTRLMPYLMQTLTKRSGVWPTAGDHDLALPVNLWIYRDAVVLGQCLHVGMLETRVEAVKQAQKRLAIPEGLARLVAEEIGQAQHLFARTRLVRQGKSDPEGVLLRLGRRIRRFGGRLDGGGVLSAVAGLLGVHNEDLQRAMGRMDERPVALSASQAAAVAARHARERLEGIGSPAEWVRQRPQILIGLAVVAGVIALLVAVLVVAGVVRLWQPDAPVPVTPPSPSAAPPLPPPVQPAVTPPAPVVGDSPPDWLKALRAEFGVEGPKPPTPPPPTPPPPTSPKPPVTNGSKLPSKVKFFGVKGDKRENGSPVEVTKPPPPKPKRRPKPKPLPAAPRPTPKTPPPAPDPSPKMPPAAPTPSAEDEQNAKRLLTIAQTLESMPGAWEDDTVKAYENVVRSYPGTAAARAATKALKRLRSVKPPAAGAAPPKPAP